MVVEEEEEEEEEGEGEEEEEEPLDLRVKRSSPNSRMVRYLYLGSN